MVLKLYMTITSEHRPVYEYWWRR